MNYADVRRFLNEVRDETEWLAAYGVPTWSAIIQAWQRVSKRRAELSAAADRSQGQAD